MQDRGQEPNRIKPLAVQGFGGLAPRAAIEIVPHKFGQALPGAAFEIGQAGVVRVKIHAAL